MVKHILDLAITVYPAKHHVQEQHQTVNLSLPYTYSRCPVCAVLLLQVSICLSSLSTNFKQCFSVSNRALGSLWCSGKSKSTGVIFLQGTSSPRLKPYTNKGNNFVGRTKPHIIGYLDLFA